MDKLKTTNCGTLNVAFCITNPALIQPEDKPSRLLEFMDRLTIAVTAMGICSFVWLMVWAVAQTLN